MATPTINMPVPVADEFDPFAAASDPIVPTYDLFGAVEISAWACHLQKGVGKVPYDPNNPNHKRLTAIDVFIQPLAEIEVKYPKTLEEHWVAEFPEWAKITLPSIKAAGFENVREINGKYARVARVPSGKKYDAKDKDGNLTGEKKDELTFKFIEFYADEAACRAAWIAAGGKPAGESAPVMSASEAERETALAFLKVLIPAAVRGKTADEAIKAAETAINNNPVVGKVFTINSPETMELITATLAA